MVTNMRIERFAFGGGCVDDFGTGGKLRWKLFRYNGFEAWGAENPTLIF